MAVFVTKDDFLRRVRICLDENMNSAALSLLGDVDTLSLDEIIGSKIEDAALSVVMACATEKLSDVAKELSGDIIISGSPRHKVTMRLPSDFVRLVRFKMSGWPHAVSAALSSDSVEYEQACSRYNAFGTKERPKVFLVSADGGMNLEAYCAGSETDTMDGCLYAPRPKIERGGTTWEDGITLGDHLLRPTVYYAAYLTALAVKDGDAATALQGIANDILAG